MIPQNKEHVATGRFSSYPPLPPCLPPGAQACVDAMQSIVESTQQEERTAPAAAAAAAAAATAAVYAEMLQDCRRKAGEATLDRLRKLCQRLARAGADGTSGIGDAVAAADRDIAEQEAVIVCYHAELLGRAESAANIYGG